MAKRYFMLERMCLGWSTELREFVLRIKADERPRHSRGCQYFHLGFVAEARRTFYRPCSALSFITLYPTHGMQGVKRLPRKLSGIRLTCKTEVKISEKETLLWINKKKINKRDTQLWRWRLKHVETALLRERKKERRVSIDIEFVSLPSRDVIRKILCWLCLISVLVRDGYAVTWVIFGGDVQQACQIVSDRSVYSSHCSTWTPRLDGCLCASCLLLQWPRASSCSVSSPPRN